MQGTHQVSEENSNSGTGETKPQVSSQDSAGLFGRSDPGGGDQDTMLPGPEPATVAWLVPINGIQGGRPFPLNREGTGIGRDVSNEIVLDDPAVSQQHAKVRQEIAPDKTEQFYIYALAGSKGTYVNDKMVVRSPLKDGDRVRIGNTILVFRSAKEQVVQTTYPDDTLRPPYAWLVLTAGGWSGRNFRISEIASIGRDQTNNDIVLDDSSVSRQHAKIRRETDDSGSIGFYIYDLATSNGTLVNGRRISRQKLIDGDVIQVGATVLVFKYVEASTNQVVGRLDLRVVLPLQVFLCHSSLDKPAVRELYHSLQSRGIDPWLDEEKLLPGEDWDLEITKAVRSSHVVLVCLSKRAITKEGYLQKEIRTALNVADEKPEGTIFIIPTKLEECEVPMRLRRWQWVSIFEPHGFDTLTRALQKRAGALGFQIP